jgi:amino-acid N-acetyltransferase
MLRHFKPMTLRAICLSQEDSGELTPVLAAAGLPIDDLQEPGRTFFRLEDDGGPVGYGGWEGRAPDRLLRSLVISSSRRSQGLGRLALATIEQLALQAGAARLHLLTTTAAAFFRSAGYQDADRREAPQAIRASKEFRSLCPASASYMVKDLTPRV